MCCEIVFLFIVVSIGIYIYQLITGKRKHRSTDIVQRSSVMHVPPDNLVCCKCKYNLRGLPEHTPGEIACPECGEQFKLADYCRPCWIGPRIRVPMMWGIYFSSAGLLAAFLAAFMMTVLAIRGDMDMDVAVAAVVVLLSIVVCVAGFCISALIFNAVVNDGKRSLALTGIGFASDVCTLLAIGSILGGFAAFIAGMFAANETRGNEIYILAGIAGALALMAMAFVFSKASGMLMNHVGRSLLRTHVKRVDEGIEPFPGLNLHWVLSNKSEAEFEAIRKSIVLFGITLYRPRAKQSSDGSE